jgi:hypothetical protein
MTYDLPEWALTSEAAGFAFVRAIRNGLLVECDWTQLPDAPVDAAAWATYRQQLRDVPDTWTPGPTVTFPEPPQ